MSGIGPNGRVVVTIAQATTVLSAWLGAGVKCTEVSPLDGGMIHAVFRLTFDPPPYTAVVKVDASSENTSLAREHARIDYLKSISPFPAPSVYFEDCSRTGLPFSVLVLEALEGVNLCAAKLSPQEQTAVDHELAESLLELHSHKRATFGEIDAPGTPYWRDIFLPRLLDLRADMDGRLAPRVLADLDIALACAPEAFAEAGEPTLIHGDLWAGNILVTRKSGAMLPPLLGEACDSAATKTCFHKQRGSMAPSECVTPGWRLSGVVDWPALQYADVECELAYLEAWNTVGPAFFEVYHAHTPRRTGYEYRRLFYWLHTYMQHVWLFGDERYKQLTAGVAKKIRS